MADKTDDEEEKPKAHLAKWMMRIIEDNDRAGMPARDAMRTIVYVLVREVNENGGPEQIKTLKSELQKIARIATGWVARPCETKSVGLTCAETEMVELNG